MLPASGGEAGQTVRLCLPSSLLHLQGQNPGHQPVITRKLNCSLRAATSVSWGFLSTRRPTVRCTVGSASKSKIFQISFSSSDNFSLQETRSSLQCLQVRLRLTRPSINIIINIVLPDFPYYQERERRPPPG